MLLFAPTPTPAAPATPPVEASLTPFPSPSMSWPVHVVNWPGSDSWTIASFWGSVALGILSLLVGILALRSAARANKEASAARAAVAAERRRTFQLEILRDLLEELDESSEIAQRVAYRPHVIKSKYRGRLAMLDPDDLSFWRQAADLERRELVDLIGGPTAVERLALDTAEVTPALWGPPPRVTKRVHKAMLKDVLDAIRVRMEARDE